ncbi:MAG: hypothetical protein LBR70_05960 [Lactobacillaceae bacterium]|jgi:hypothetical protein|nr:hypothetical protein [Lactobacillaceae bacterium]
MQISEKPSAFRKYMEVLKKIKVIRNKEKTSETEDQEYINELAADVNDFVYQYIKGGTRSKKSFADLTDKIDADMRFLLNNLNERWREDVLYLRDNLRRRARAEKSDYSHSLDFAEKFSFFIMIFLAVFIGIRIKAQIDTSFDISSKMGIENAIRIHKKSRNYNKYVAYLDPVPENVISWFFWPVKPSSKERAYYNQYIKSNLDVLQLLVNEGLICTNIKDFNNVTEAERKSFIVFLDVLSDYITKYLEEHRDEEGSKRYYEAMINAYTDKFPCKKSWGSGYPAAR